MADYSSSNVKTGNKATDPIMSKPEPGTPLYKPPLYTPIGGSIIAGGTGTLINTGTGTGGGIPPTKTEQVTITTTQDVGGIPKGTDLTVTKEIWYTPVTTLSGKGTGKYTEHTRYLYRNPSGEIVPIPSDFKWGSMKETGVLSPGLKTMYEQQVGVSLPASYTVRDVTSSQLFSTTSQYLQAEPNQFYGVNFPMQIEREITPQARMTPYLYKGSMGGQIPYSAPTSNLRVFGFTQSPAGKAFAGYTAGGIFGLGVTLGIGALTVVAPPVGITAASAFTFEFLRSTAAGEVDFFDPFTGGTIIGGVIGGPKLFKAFLPEEPILKTPMKSRVTGATGAVSDIINEPIITRGGAEKYLGTRTSAFSVKTGKSIIAGVSFGRLRLALAPEKGPVIKVLGAMPESYYREFGPAKPGPSVFGRDLWVGHLAKREVPPYKPVKAMPESTLKGLNLLGGKLRQEAFTAIAKSQVKQVSGLTQYTRTSRLRNIFRLQPKLEKIVIEGRKSKNIQKVITLEPRALDRFRGLKKTITTEKLKPKSSLAYLEEVKGPRLEARINQYKIPELFYAKTPFGTKTSFGRMDSYYFPKAEQIYSRGALRAEAGKYDIRLRFKELTRLKEATVAQKKAIVNLNKPVEFYQKPSRNLGAALSQLKEKQIARHVTETRGYRKSMKAETRLTQNTIRNILQGQRLQRLTPSTGEITRALGRLPEQRQINLPSMREAFYRTPKTYGLSTTILEEQERIKYPKPRPEQITLQGTREEQGRLWNPLTGIIQETLPKQERRQAQQTAVKLRKQQLQRQTTMISVPKPPIKIKPPIPPVPTKKAPGSIVNVRIFKKEKVIKSPITKYKPTLISYGLGIYGKRPKRLTGLEIRPIEK